MRLFFIDIRTVMVMALLLLGSCSEPYDDNSTPSGESNEDTQYDSGSMTLSKGFDNFSISIPMAERYQDFVDEHGSVAAGVDIYMRGRSINDLYAITAQLDIESDMMVISVTDMQALDELYHQEYIVTYIAAHLSTRSGEAESIPDNAIEIGAILSATDPDNIYFLTTFSRNGSANGSGDSIYDPIIITTASAFKSEIVDPLNNNNSLSGKYFLQGDNINFTAISSKDDYVCAGAKNKTYFKGHYDGGMMAIQQLSFGDSATDNVAMFYGLGDGGLICNWIFTSVKVTAGDIGAIVAANCDGGEITHLFIESGCSVTVDTNGGSFVGSGINGKIVNCCSKAAINGSQYCGGFWGSADDETSSATTISFLGENTYYGAIDLLDKYAGGLVGYINMIDNIVIEDVAIAGTISSTAGEHIECVGGLIGYMSYFYNCTIKNATIGSTRSYNDYYVYYDSYEGIAMNIKASSSAGGLIGVMTGYSSCTNDIFDSALDITNSSLADCGDQSFVVENSFIGGGFGSVKNVMFERCDFTNNCDIIGGYYVGGFCGYMQNSISKSSGSITLHLCNNGNIYADDEYVGGLIGEFKIDKSISRSSVKLELTNNGDVSNASGSYTGGCIGYMDDAKNKDNYIVYKNYGSVSGNRYVGGFVGFATSSSSSFFAIKTTDTHYNGWNSSNDVVITGTDYVGGLLGYGGVFDECVEVYGKSDAIVSASDSESYVGGAIGKIYIESDFDDGKSWIKCYDTGSNLTVDGGMYTGGVFGVFYAIAKKETKLLDIDYLSSSSKVSGSRAVGGVLGYCGDSDANSGDDEVDTTFSGCINRGTISATDYGCGGIVGLSYLDTANNPYLKFSQCANWGAIISSSTESKAGGILGYSDAGNHVNISECCNGGDVSGSNNRGGLVGSSDQYLHIENCYNIGTVAKGGSNVAGLVGSVPKDGDNNKISILSSYNVGVSGYGTLGGVDGLGNGDVSKDGVSHLYYYNVGIDGELDFGHWDSTKLSKSDMTSGKMSLSSTYWTTPANDGSSLPYLKNIRYYKFKPKI